MKPKLLAAMLLTAVGVIGSIWFSNRDARPRNNSPRVQNAPAVFKAGHDVATSFGTKGDGKSDNAAAFAALAAYGDENPGSEFHFPCGTYRYSGGLVFTQPVRLIGGSSSGTACAILDYSGSENALQLGPKSGLSESNYQYDPYIVRGFKFIGGNRAANGIYVEPYVTDPVIRDNEFINFTLAPAYQIVLADNNWHAELVGNRDHNLNPYSRNWLNLAATSGINGTQIRVENNLVTGYSALGVAIRVQGAAAIILNNKLEGSTVLFDCSKGFTMNMGGQFVHNYQEAFDRSAVTYKGACSGLTIEGNYANLHGEGDADVHGEGGTATEDKNTHAFLGPWGSSGDSLSNSAIFDNTIANAPLVNGASKELVTLTPGSTNINLGTNWQYLNPTNTLVAYSVLSNKPSRAIAAQYLPFDAATVVTNGPSANLLSVSEPLISQLSRHSYNVRQGSFASFDLANGVAFPATAQEDYAYLPCVLASGSAYTMSAYFKFNDGVPPAPGPPARNHDFYFVVGGVPEPSARYKVQYIGAATYRVSMTDTPSLRAPGLCGVMRPSASSGRGFAVTGFQVESGSSVSNYAKVSAGAPQGFTSIDPLTQNFPALQTGNLNVGGATNSGPGGTVTVLALYRVATYQDSWTVNGVVSARRANQRSQQIALAALPPHAMINFSRIKLESSCHGASGTLTATVGDSANPALLISNAYNLQSTPSQTNMWQSTTAGPDTDAATALTMTFNSATTNLSRVSDCVIDVWENWGVGLRP